MKSYIGAIDQGTTSTRLLVFDKRADVLFPWHKRNIRQIYPQPVTRSSGDSCGQRKNQGNGKRKGLKSQDLAAIGITKPGANGRVEAKTGKPAMNAIVCGRTCAWRVSQRREGKITLARRVAADTILQWIEAEMDSAECFGSKSSRRGIAFRKRRYVPALNRQQAEESTQPIG